MRMQSLVVCAPCSPYGLAARLPHLYHVYSCFMRPCTRRTFWRFDFLIGNCDKSCIFSTPLATQYLGPAGIICACLLGRFAGTVDPYHARAHLPHSFRGPTTRRVFTARQHTHTHTHRAVLRICANLNALSILYRLVLFLCTRFVLAFSANRRDSLAFDIYDLSYVVSLRRVCRPKERASRRLRETESESRTLNAEGERENCTRLSFGCCAAPLLLCLIVHKVY